MKLLFANIGKLFVLVMLISVLLDYGYRQKFEIKYEPPKNILPHAPIADKYQIVSLGNSHAQDGMDFKMYKAKTLKLSNAAQSFDYDLANLRMYEKQIADNALIIINVSPISFSQKKSGKKDSLQYNYYDGRLSPFLIPNLNVGDYLQSQIFPFVRTGYLFREREAKEVEKRLALTEKWPDEVMQKLEQEKLKKDISLGLSKPIEESSPSGVIVVPKQVELRAGVVQEVVDDYYKVQIIENELKSPLSTHPDMLKESVDFILNKWLNTDGFGKEYFQVNRKDLEKLIEYCIDRKWKPVLVSIPISEVLAIGLGQTYMQEYVNDNLNMANQAGLDYYDFNLRKDFTNNKWLFKNADHLSDKGAKIFSYILLEKLIETGYLNRAVDGYVH